MLVLQYEKGFLEWVNVALPQITEAMYTEDIESLLSRDAIVKYPSFIFTRESSDMLLPRPYDAWHDMPNGELYHMRGFAFEQEYTGRIAVERQSDAFHIANVLRQYWSYHSYVWLCHPDADFKLPVGLRFLGMRINSERSNTDQRGALRYVEFKWKSQLLLEAYDSWPKWEGYRIWITPNGVEAEEWMVKEEKFTDGDGSSLVMISLRESPKDT